MCAESCSTPVLPQWHVKDPDHSAKSAGGRLHLNTHTSSTQRSRSGLTMPLFRHSVAIYPETSSQASCQGTFGHSRLSSLSHCGLILAQRVELVYASKSLLEKKKKKRKRGMDGQTFSPNPRKRGKSGQPSVGRPLHTHVFPGERK